jgi:hypothetical protein
MYDTYVFTFLGRCVPTCGSVARLNPPVKQRRPSFAYIIRLCLAKKRRGIATFIWSHITPANHKPLALLACSTPVQNRHYFTSRAGQRHSCQRMKYVLLSSDRTCVGEESMFIEEERESYAHVRASARSGCGSGVVRLHAGYIGWLAPSRQMGLSRVDELLQKRAMQNLIRESHKTC